MTSEILNKGQAQTATSAPALRAMPWARLRAAYFTPAAGESRLARVAQTDLRPPAQTRSEGSPIQKCGAAG